MCRSVVRYHLISPDLFMSHLVRGSFTGVFPGAVPARLCACPWQVRLHEFEARRYAIGVAPLGATTLTSKFTIRSPDTVAAWAPIPCAVWQTEHEKPSLMCRACSLKLALLTTLARS